MKKLMMFLMIAIPLVVVIIVNLTTTAVRGDVNIAVDKITLSQDYEIANVGDSEYLTYHIQPETATNKDVVWASDNEQVATVDNTGRVDFVGIGKVRITVTTLDNNRNAECSFYVTDTKVHQVVLTAKQNFVYVNKTLQLTATVLPYEAVNNHVNFVSNNPSVAEVDSNGKVTGISEGYATITATSEDGGLQGVLDLEVWNPVTGLSVEEDTIVTSQTTEQIYYQIQPENATNRMVNFEVDNLSVASVSQTGQITFKQAGEVNVTITTVDGGFSKVIKYIYTDGYAYSLDVNFAYISMTVGDADMYLEYTLTPTNISKTKVEFVSDDEDVAYIVSERYLHANMGGGTTIRARVHKNADEVIEIPIPVMIKSPATGVQIEDGITATNTYQLKPTSLPEDSTNEEYFYHIDEQYSSLATVDETGLVTFTTDQPCTVEIKIYANEDNSNVFTTTKVTYTANMASSFNLIDHDVDVKIGEVINLNYSYTPKNATVLPLTITLLSSTPWMHKGEVVQILNNKIVAVGGGKAAVKLEMTLYDGNVVEEVCNINVKVDVTKIDINLKLDYFNNQYVTAEKEVEFAGEIYPTDATNQTIVWSIDDHNLASIVGNKIVFRQVGVIKLSATIDDVENSVEIYYTGSKPIYAELKAIKDQTTCDIPQKIMAGESFEIVVNKIIPSNLADPTISLQTTNQRATVNGNVIEVNNNKVTALTSGSATVVIYVCHWLRYSVNIVVEKLPESIVVNQDGAQITTQSIELLYSVLPEDASNKAVKFVVNNTDIAEVDGATLTFKQNGVAKITAYCLAKPDVKLDFTIEKIETSAKRISPNEQNISVNKGDILVFDISEEYSISILDSSPIVDGQEVAMVDGKYLKTTGAGKVNIQISTATLTYSMQITVNQLVESINLISDLDFVDNEYIFANNYVDLEFEVKPDFAINLDVKISIIKQTSTDGMGNNWVYLVGKRIYFTKAGSAVIQVDSLDGNATAIYHLRYTAGDAIDATLNVEDTLVLEVGEQKQIEPVRWLPKDTTNTAFVLMEDSITPNKVISVNNKTKTITALSSGETKLIVELSNGITKEIVVRVSKKVTDIDVAEDALTSNERYTIVASAIPADATNATLAFELLPNDIATIEDNVLVFKKPGTVKVVVSSTDGSDVKKTISVTSTMGYLNKIELENSSLTLNKNQSTTLNVKAYPTDTQAKDIQYKILSSQAADGSDKEVIRLSADGTIEAIYGGKAKVRVFSHNYGGEEIFADCEITVLSPVESFDLTFDHKIDYYQSAYTTSKNEIGFTTRFVPEDALIRTLKFELSSDIAKVEGNKIVFNQIGRVTVKITSDDKSNGEISKTYTFYYAGNNLIEASLNELGIENGVIKLKAGENFKFNLSRTLPSDNDNLTFSIKNMFEAKVDVNKSVAHFDSDTIYADHGGNAIFDLYVNNLMLREISLVVTQDATDITIWGDTEIYISQQRYAIDATVYPSDSTQNKLGYSANGSEIAEVGANGVVVFKEFGTVKITVYVVSNPAISKTITIQYTKELKSIQFSATRDKMFVNEYVDLVVIPQPFDAEDFEYELFLEDNDIAKLEKRDEGYRLKGLNKQGGTVKVVAKVIGKDMSIEKEFTFYDKIKDIELTPSTSKDNFGMGGYRVFGNRFLDSSNKFINTYQMEAKTNPSNDLKNLLVWTSNNSQVATVDQNGLVTVLSPGKVTITVSQIAPYEDALVTSNSYTFTFVNGINVENFDQYVVAYAQLSEENKGKNENYTALVLQNDIIIEDTDDTKTVVILSNLYGNGYMLDHSKVAVGGLLYHFEINRNNLVVDNVVLRGYGLGEKDSLSTLKEKGTTLGITASTGVLLYNSRIENGHINVIVDRSVVEIKGCLFLNNALTGIRLEHNNDGPASVLTVEDCIFSNSLLAGIILNPKKNVSGQEDTLILKGTVRFYNWITLDDAVEGFTEDIEKLLKALGFDVLMPTLIRQVKDILSRQANMSFVYNDVNYYHLGVAKINIEDLKWGSSASYDRTELDPKCNYNDAYVSGIISLGVVSCKLEVRGITFTNNTPFIKPWEKYTDNQGILLGIRQPSRL